MDTLLVIDDEPGHRLMVRAVMEDAGWRVVEAASGEAALRHLGGCAPGALPSVALLDMRMPGMDGMAALAAIQGVAPGLPVVLLTAYGTVGSAVEAMKRGAFDYLTKPADNEELKAVLDKAAEYGRLLSENKELRRRVESGGAAVSLVGESQGLRQVRELAAQVGPAEATVLILGESGTGKELVAELVHAMSPRASKPLVKVNCAALPGELLESELFGYVKGAFTGAVKDKPGRFQLASGGTLFLDEVGELPLKLQAKLLRALQERLVEPLGSVKPVPADVRIVAATNRDLRAEVARGAFREDLYFRLAVLEIRIPPLRERLEDLPVLAAHLLAKLGERNKKSVRSVSPAYLEALGRYGWPGNVRELENVLERSIILSRSDTLTPQTLPPHMTEGAAACAPCPEPAVPGPVGLEEAERQALVRALEANEGHRERTAEALGVSRRTLQYKLRKYGLARRGSER
ncbi:Transcriptional regulatory protein ZraR [Fundidesulfovibrio magnetotacticus]|uniref:Transcriptional regulatory protein ZraR n=1 Tax=Fundidesulfovibrio magnetotacticus TaxID=2730080 RepID=A0A6V8M514_9BACT|nr:sigma-54 dependent transcriptional regulator [Fundidesulfovibrio magnetotacticus]GFK95595.1 Transcriptional regulatory protein ZraR [Fundidesulfovibrio magnetotacticus]